jgi:hypothetical protein
MDDQQRASPMSSVQRRAGALWPLAVDYAPGSAVSSAERVAYVPSERHIARDIVVAGFGAGTREPCMLGIWQQRTCGASECYYRNRSGP